MGEYAKLGGESIKIGTCESMYYLRWNDRFRVDPQPGNVDPQKDAGLFFRLPFPDEDELLPGEYSDYQRGYRLGRKDRQYWEDWTPDGLDEADPGNVQLHHQPSGLLLSVPCHHGTKLPDVGEARAHWNGKKHALELAHVKSMPDGTLRPVYRCRFCGSMWSDDWEAILPYCGLDKEMLRRLEAYAHVGREAAACTEGGE